MNQAVRDVAAEINRASPARLLAQTERPDPTNLDAAPIFVARISPASVVVSPPAAHDDDVVAPLHQARREIARVLGRRGDVRVEGLVEDEDPHERSYA